MKIRAAITAIATSARRNERTTATGKNACTRETMMKIRAVMMFMIAQVALAKQHTSRRSADTADTAGRAIRHNPNKHAEIPENLC